MELAKLTEKEFVKFSELIHEIAGIYLKESKMTLLSNRLRKRLSEKKFDSFEEYYNYIKNSQDQFELNEMLNAVQQMKHIFLEM